MEAYVSLQSPRNEKLREVNPRENANWFSIFTLSWLNSLIKKGAKAPLQENDTWPLPTHDTAATLHAKFEKHWEVEKDKPTPKLHVALWHTFKGQIIWGLSLYIIYAGIMLLQPIMIQSTLQYLAEDPVVHTSLHILNGYVLATLLTLLSFISVTIIDFAQYCNTHTGCNAKSIVIDMVFMKTLKLSGYAKQEMSTGEVVTMASVDAERVFMGFTFGYWTIVGPLMLLATYIMIGNQLGVVVGVTGGGIMLIFLIMGFVSGRKVGEVRRKLLGVQANRVKLTNEILQGIRVVKLYAWEVSLQEQLASIRNEELRLLKLYQTRRTFNTVVLFIAPVVSLAVCLLVFVALGNDLTVPIAFTALAYVNIARSPCMVFSTAVMMTSEMVASCQRVSKFLCADEVKALGAAEGPAQVNISHASFSWDAPTAVSKLPALTLKNINFQLEPGSLTIVVGPVGSGKSSLV
ncbi:canalicular multispecific organic anion transporter, partial [Thraustotheca clavata]